MNPLSRPEGDTDIQDCIDNLIIAENAEKLKETEL